MPTYNKNLFRSAPMRAMTALIIAIVFGFGTFDARAQSVSQSVSLEDALKTMSIGSPDAPVVMHEYSSLTCPHCAAFHTDTLPKIKKDYVDTGKVRIEFHDFPLGGLALGALMIVRCSGPERNVDFFNMLYETQGDWAQNNNPRGALIALARFYGMSADDVNACLANKALQTAIAENAQMATDVHNIQSTPTFIVEGKVIPGNMPYEDFQDILDDALAAKGVE